MKDFHRLCLQFVRMSYGLPVVAPDAGTAWNQAKHKHPTTDAGSIPAGVPVFWELPSVADHVALSTGDGMCLSTDARRRGRVDAVRIDSITEQWGGVLLGWTEDLGTFRVYRPAAPENNVTKARDHLRLARREVRQAVAALDKAPEDRAVVHAVGEQLENTIKHLTKRLERLPKR